MEAKNPLGLRIVSALSPPEPHDVPEEGGESYQPECFMFLNEDMSVRAASREGKGRSEEQEGMTSPSVLLITCLHSCYLAY